MLLVPLLLIAGCSGCGDSSTSTFPGEPGGMGAGERAPDALLNNAMDNLRRLEEFASGEMLQQIIGQLNQWAQAQKPPADWRLDPLVATLPPAAAELPAVKGLDQLRFPLSDASVLQEIVWLHAVSGWARGEKLDELDRAKRLFDWTVRNIQLEIIPDDQAGQRVGQMPWETLLLGRGTWEERAWVFILLARQQHLDAALLVAGAPDDPQGQPARLWLGVLSDRKIYLFDPELGLPIPAPDGIRLQAAGPLDIQPATLAQVADDDALLRRLDLDQGRPYPVSSADLGRVVALIEASPVYLSRRMKLIESRLKGKQRKMVLTTDATAEAERWKAAAGIADAQLWMLPYRTLYEHTQLSPQQAEQRVARLLPQFFASYTTPPGSEESAEAAARHLNPFSPLHKTPLRSGAMIAPLYRGRVLHLKLELIKGKLVGQQEATKFYQEARPSDRQLANLEENYYKTALKAVQSLPAVDRKAARQKLKQAAAQWARIQAPLLRRASQDASYWLGLISFELGLVDSQRHDDETALRHCAVAIDYFRTRTLAASPDGPWTHGAHYNLARCYEATRQYDDAVAEYAADMRSPSYFGNLLRARWLDELRRKSKPKEPDAKTEKPAPAE